MSLTFLIIYPGVVEMKTVSLSLDPAVVLFYTKIAEYAGMPLEQVLSDALFRLAGELSLNSLQKKD